MNKSTNLLHSITVVSCLAVATVASFGAVSAQQLPPPPPAIGNPSQRPAEGGPLAGGPGWLHSLDLTREQRGKIFDLLALNRAEREQQLRNRFVAGPGDEDDIRDLIASGKLTKREAMRRATERADEMKKRLVKNAEIMGAIYEEVLTAEQRQTLQEIAKRAPQEVAGRMQHRRELRGGAGFGEGLPRGEPGVRPHVEREGHPERM